MHRALTWSTHALPRWMSATTRSCVGIGSKRSFVTRIPKSTSVARPRSATICAGKTTRRRTTPSSDSFPIFARIRFLRPRSAASVRRKVGAAGPGVEHPRAHAPRPGARSTRRNSTNHLVPFDLVKRLAHVSNRALTRDDPFWRCRQTRLVPNVGLVRRKMKRVCSVGNWDRTAPMRLVRASDEPPIRYELWRIDIRNEERILPQDQQRTRAVPAREPYGMGGRHRGNVTTNVPRQSHAVASPVQDKGDLAHVL